MTVTGLARDVIRGGDAGLGSVSYLDGDPGAALFVMRGGVARISGASFELGYTCFPESFQAIVNDGSLVEPTPDDPSMELVGEPTPGAPLTFRLHGPPGGEATLYLGRLPVVMDVGAVGSQLTTRERSYPLGVIPASGTLDFVFPMPAFFRRGFKFFAQGGVVLPSGEERLSNSTPVVLR